MSEPTIGPIEHISALCREGDCTCWCQSCERRNAIVNAARALLAAHDGGYFEGWFGSPDADPVAALRAALEEKP